MVPSNNWASIIEIRSLHVQTEVAACQQNRKASALSWSLPRHHHPFVRVSICVILHVALLSRFRTLEVGTSYRSIISKVDDGVMALPVRNESPSLVVASVVLVEDEVSILAVTILIDTVGWVES